jgi:glycosyltransferase involved in cell wall biosynthesis
MNQPTPTGPRATRVSVVIPAFRSAATIRRALDSALGQTRPPDEVVVVDDGSPDDLAAVVEGAYGARVTLVRKSNGGAASARNAGLDRATGDLVAFLDADDYWEPEKLARQLAVLSRHPETALVAGAYFEEKPGAPRQEAAVRPGPPRWYGRVLSLRGRDAFRLATLVWTGTVLLRRGALGAERFVSGLEPAEDRDLWVRVVSHHPAYLMPEPLATAVLVGDSLSRSSAERDCTNMLRVVERHGDLLGLPGRCLWRSHTLYRWANLDPRPRTALPRLLRSLLLWPLPYTSVVDSHPFGRAKRLVLLLLAAVGDGPGH